MEKKLYRDEHRKVIGGVCAGLADYFNVDVTIVRLFFVLALILKGGGGLIYIIMWIVMPRRNFIPPVDYTVPPATPFNEPNPSYRPTSSWVPPSQPYVQQPKGPSTAAIVGGAVLILLGGGLLLDQMDIIPDWHFDEWWPAILVVIGLILIVTRGKQHPVQTWQQPETKAEPKDETTSTDNPSNDI